MTPVADATNDRTDQPVVLVVDDEPAIVDLLTQLLEDEGYTVACADDGQVAYEKVRELCPDLVIADVMMPRMDGFELIDRLSDGPAPVPVILMSAAVMSQRREAAFIAKPFDLGELLELVHSHLA